MTDTLMDTPAAPPRWRGERRSELGAHRWTDAHARHPPDQDLRRRQAAAVAALPEPERRSIAEAMFERRARRSGTRARRGAIAVVTADRGRARGRRGGGVPRCCDDTRETGQSAAALIGIAHALAERLRPGAAGAGRHAAAGRGRARRAAGRGAGAAPLRDDRARPPRHRHQRAAARPPDAIEPSFGPGSFERHGRRPRRAGADAASWTGAVAGARRGHARGPRAALVEALHGRAGGGAAPRAPALAPRRRVGLSLSATSLPALPEVRPGDDLAALLAAAAPADLADGDVLVVAHKVGVQGRGADRGASRTCAPASAPASSPREHGKDPRLVQVVLDESAEVLRAERGVLICVTRHGLVCANAGVDRSNCRGDEVVLLPDDPDASARAAARRHRGGARRAAGGPDHRLLRPRLAGRPDRRGDRRRRPRAARRLARPARRAGGELRATAIAVADAVRGAADLARAKDSLAAGRAGARARAVRDRRGRPRRGGAAPPARGGPVPLVRIRPSQDFRDTVSPMATQAPEETRVLDNYVGGAWTPASSGERLDVTNPATGETLAQVPLSGAGGPGRRGERRAIGAARVARGERDRARPAALRAARGPRTPAARSWRCRSPPRWARRSGTPAPRWHA